MVYGSPVPSGIARDVRDLYTQQKAEAVSILSCIGYYKGNYRGDMAQVDDNWQTKYPSISQRTKFVFNKELLSDVKFVVPVSNGESETKVIPAHKFVLAISSPVFYAMFYGQIAETKDSIELPDCEYESLLELLRYMYSDEVTLTGSNVMHVLYLAKKYMVPSLADKCTKYLRDNLEASNVFSILPHVQKFEDKDLEHRCWVVIEMDTEEAVTSDEFVTLERSLVESVVKREKLNVKEVELFKAIDRWATIESERQGIVPDGGAKRRILGDEIVKAVRFPLMSLKEFSSVVFDSNILIMEEIGAMMKYYSGVSLTSPLAFIQSPRSESFYQCCRFNKLCPPDGPWCYSEYSADAIGLTVSKVIKLQGVRHFGSKGGEYTVSIEVKLRANDFFLVEQSGSYNSEKDELHDYYMFDVLFKPPICLDRGQVYDIISNIKGPKSWYGEEGQETVECRGVHCTFSYSGASSSGTNVTRGQFPTLLLS